MSDRITIERDGGVADVRLNRADKMNARIAMILGESEVESGVVQLKDLAGKTQEEVPRADAGERAKALLS